MKFNNLDNATATTLQFSAYFGLEPKLNFTQEIQQHPFYPSLLSISEVLETEAGIKNFAVKISTAQLQEITLPCMAHLQTKGGEYALIYNLKNDTVFYELNGKKKSISVTDFEKIWSGVVLVSEADKIALKKTFQLQKFIPYILPFLSILLLGIIFQNIISLSFLNSFAFIGTFVCLLAGLTVSVLLLIQSLGKSNALIQQLCGSESKQNCNHILGSKAANVTSWLSLSDLGFLYFSGNFLLLIFSQSITIASLLISFNLLALPFTFWSVYYQWRIAKTWCRLCLMIQGLFWLQAIFSIYAISQNNFIITNLNPLNLTVALTLFIFPTVLWLNSKPLFKSVQQVKPLKAELNKFKFNVESFTNLLKSQKQFTGTLPKTTIVLGNLNSNLQITMVSNPFCNPCAKAHQFLEEWIAKGVDFKLNIVYTFTMEDTDKQKQFFKQLIAIQKTDKNLVVPALKDWYSEDYQKLDNWKLKFPIQIEEVDKLELLEQVNWCKLNEIQGTPTFYINSYKLPENYRLKDLKYVFMNLE